MGAALNPFPDLPVQRFAGEQRNLDTIATESITSARRMIDSFVETWPRPSALLIRVSGEYGSGKTHLMIDTANRAREKLSSVARGSVTVQISATETDTLPWFRSNVQPLLRPLLPEADDAPDARAEVTVSSMVAALFIRAATDVAGAAPLTSALTTGDESLDSIRDLLEEDRLNETAVVQRFRHLLRTTLSDLDESVLATVGSLITQQASAAARWLLGEPLSQKELLKLGVRESLTTEKQAADVLVAVAALCSENDRLFIILVDEFEHFARYDEHQSFQQNATWLKRLLEQLSRYPALVIVSGHTSAWKKRNDVRDRFTGYIEVRPISASDVLQLIASRVPSAHVTLDEARTIEEAADGNIRRVLSLCRALYERTDGLDRPMSDAEIWTCAHALGQRISATQVKMAVFGAVEEWGLSVRENDVIDGLPFDLTGREGERLRVVSDVKHATTERQSQEYARLFKERFDEMKQKHPQLVGLFVASGAVDSLFLDRLRELEPACIWLDISEDITPTSLQNELSRALTAAVGMRTIAPQTDRERRQVEAALDAREAQTVVAHDANQTRIAAAAAAGAAPAARSEEQDIKVHPTYAELTKVGTWKRIRYILTPRVLTLLTFSVALVVITFTLPDSIMARFVGFGVDPYIISPPSSASYRLMYETARSEAAQRARVVGYALAGFTALLAIFLIYRQTIVVDDFFDRSLRILRLLYLRGASAEQLVEANDILFDLLERSGPRSARHIASESVAKRFPILQSNTIQS